MAFRDVTDRDAVVAALDEFDRLGREQFLAKYGFGEARAYFLEHEDRQYDSKAIVAAAHGHQLGEPLTPSDFSGGDATVATLLKRLGFTVTRPFNAPDWTRDELILALDLYLTGQGLASWSKTSHEVINLSALLRSSRSFLTRLGTSRPSGTRRA